MSKDIKKVEITGSEYHITIAGICGLPDVTYRIDKATFDKSVKEKELTNYSKRKLKTKSR